MSTSTYFFYKKALQILVCVYCVLMASRLPSPGDRLSSSLGHELVPVESTAGFERCYTGPLVNL